MAEAAVGWVVVERQPAEVVSYPDGRVEIVSSGRGGVVADAWNARSGAASEEDAELRLRELEERRAAARLPSDEELQRVVDQRHAAWEREMTEELAKLESGSMAGFGTPEGRRRSYMLRNPPPTLETVRDEKLRAAGVAEPVPVEADTPPQATVEEEPDHWWGRLIGPIPDATRRLAGPGPLPRAEIASFLSELANDDWEVVHVSEDREVNHGDERSRATCVGLSIMVRRDVGARA